MKNNAKFCLLLLIIGLVSLPLIADTKQKDKNMSTALHVFKSAYDFKTTVARIQTTVTQKGMTVFAVIDHQEAAQQNSLSLRPTTVIVFGSPKAGTPLMEQAEYLGLFLPLKVLVTEVNSEVQVVMEDVLNIAKTLNMPPELVNPLSKATTLIKNTVEK